MNAQHFDVIIIGTGAGGGTLLHKLAPTGKRILVLERGDFIPREKENWSPEAVLAGGRYNVSETWTNGNGTSFTPGTHYFVGGNTKFYGAALLRMRPEDFGELRHYGGISPAWPIGYADLEPYYCEAEALYHVHGEHGEDPTEGPASKQFRYPSISHEPRIQQLHNDLEKQGLKPFHVPLGIRLNEKNRLKSDCIRCNTCDGFPCMVNAKSDADVLCVRPALERPNVTLLTGAYVERLETSDSGREVTGVHIARNGERERYSADMVVVSCGAINSAALMLRSANDVHPTGLANGSDMVGRNYMCHNNSAVLALSKDPNETVFQKTIAVNDFYFRAPDWDYPLGHISMIGKSEKVMLSLGAPKVAPGLVLDQMARHSIDFWLTSEDLPHPENRITVSKEGKIEIRYRDNNTEAHNRLLAKLKGLMKHVGCRDDVFAHMHLYLRKKIPLAGVAHQNGTMRMGADPNTSVLDENCRAHELMNLYVVDGSCFVSSSAVNPALTIMANALRVGDHLKERLS